MTDSIVKAEELTEGSVILLPFGKTATVSEPPKVGRTFVTFRTQHGPSKLRRGEEVLVQQAEPAKAKPDPNRLLTQTEARQEAAKLIAQGIPAIAGAVPLGSWGGKEKGWTVYIVAGEAR